MMICACCGTIKDLVWINNQDWVCELCRESYQNRINKENDIEASEEAFKLLKLASISFLAVFEQFYHKSENGRVNDIFWELEGHLKEFHLQAEEAEKNIRKYYR